MQYPQSTSKRLGWIWKLQLPPKIKFFLWRGFMNSLAVNYNLRHRRMDVPNVCPLCATEEETHRIFFDFEFARAFWFSCPLQLDVTRLGQGDMKAYARNPS
ncbi:unnamed protein product [Prunus armeniaca]|uniref:Reverse transcriptase zinc-binding domain-containing protein n=1 Tax=Prunus armeniaca TaxID=36596 RepID=A0A6J5UTL4_PRUAR|nr:unnamed protein product [Prunus armeniaca]